MPGQFPDPTWALFLRLPRDDKRGGNLPIHLRAILLPGAHNRGMSAEIHRPQWEIDKRLESLLDKNIRVRAHAFCPPHWNGEMSQVIEASALLLPDNTTVGDGELYLEGRLLAFRREVAIVFVFLGRPDAAGDTANGRMVYRGKAAIILPGPATVQLHQDQFIEMIPTDGRLYWSHLGATGPQFNLPLDD